MTNSSNPDQIRADIERTRATLSSDVDTLAYEANPATKAKRTVGKAADRLSGIRNTIMGTASDTGHHTSQATSSAKSTVADTVQSASGAMQSAPDAVTAQTQGNPLAAGLIAFGAGLLVSALIPASEKEQQAAATLQDKAQPLTDEVTAVAKQTAQNLQQPAQDAAAAVKETATDAVGTVKDESTTAAHDVQDHATNATTTVADHHN